MKWTRAETGWGFWKFVRGFFFRAGGWGFPAPFPASVLWATSHGVYQARRQSTWESQRHNYSTRFVWVLLILVEMALWISVCEFRCRDRALCSIVWQFSYKGLIRSAEKSWELNILYKRAMKLMIAFIFYCRGCCFCWWIGIGEDWFNCNCFYVLICFSHLILCYFIFLFLNCWSYCLWLLFGWCRPCWLL